MTDKRSEFPLVDSTPERGREKSIKAKSFTLTFPWEEKRFQRKTYFCWKHLGSDYSSATFSLTLLRRTEDHK